MPRKTVNKDNDEDDKIFTEKELHRIVADLQIDLWMGRDKENPSITTRLAMIEKYVADQAKTKWLLLAAVIGLFLDIIKNFFKF
jgi:signal recognition particle subunit SEC65